MFRLALVVAGWLSLILGIIGLFLPLLPTTPFLLLSAACFSRGSERCERWLLNHPRLGPAIHNWRTHRALSTRAKQMATLTMLLGSALALYQLPSPWCWLPTVICTPIACWLWQLPAVPQRI